VLPRVDVEGESLQEEPADAPHEQRELTDAAVTR
jgi:hypothetical protein